MRRFRPACPGAHTAPKAAREKNRAPERLVRRRIAKKLAIAHPPC
jgi:hypothetical protein